MCPCDVNRGAIAALPSHGKLHIFAKGLDTRGAFIRTPSIEELDRYRRSMDTSMKGARVDVIYDYVGSTGKPTLE